MRVCPSCPRSRSPRAGWTLRCVACRRVGARPGHQRAEDLRPAAAGDRGRCRSAGAAHRQAHRGRPRRRPRAARAPDVGGAPAALRQARVAARPHLAAARPAGRRQRAAPAGVRHQAARRGSRCCAPRTSPSDDAVATLGPEAWPDPPPLRELLAAPGRSAAARRAARPARDRRDRALVGRRDPVDGDALAVQARRRPRATTRPTFCATRASSASTARSSTTSGWSQLPIPDKLPMPLEIHRRAGEPCPRCGATIEAVHYEDYVMCYCPHDQTGGRVLKDRRLSRLLK